jgi:hypothetical protein
VGVGLAAAGGAIAGSAIGAAIMDNNHYWGIPYGAPVYREPYNRPYYQDKSGNNVYVNNKHNEPVINQWNQQGAWDNRSTWAPGNAPNQNGTAPEQNHADNHPPNKHYHEGWGGFNGGRFGRRR